MNEAREQILSTIRRSLKGGEPKTMRRLDELQARLSRTTPMVQPHVDDDLLALFCLKHVAVHGTYERLPADQIEEGVRRHLRGLEVDPQFCLGGGPLLDQVAWSDEVFTYRKSADKDTRVAVSEAFAGVSETGTLVMRSSAENPPSHNFLPDDHIVVLHQQRIVRWTEDVWALLRKEDAFPSRAVNFITGPSKTGDIEQTIQYGAHGPRRLHILIIDA
ncbi:MAG: lactate utilization protein C [Gammaproteobacteria bacterium]|jgi:L-lactate dehydrogenase complex protein LldG|nr:lactate utilization protein C [Gammaproteobacteria bacterium]NDA14185.1 lactate utilization protein C [Gammaproteobacteria bacterium]NDG43146.1 lactate utilization protein C [Gammaproteobacteria bacterium]